MQAYKTVAVKPGAPTKITWQGSLADAAKARKAAKAEEYKADSEPVNIPTSKAELLQFLNELTQ